MLINSTTRLYHNTRGALVLHTLHRTRFQNRKCSGETTVKHLEHAFKVQTTIIIIIIIVRMIL